MGLAVSSVILGACGSTDGDGPPASGGSASGGGDTGKGSGGSSSTAGTTTGGAAGVSSGGGATAPVDVCAGFPLDCIPLCQGGLCDCYCDLAPDCTTKPVSPDASCEQCYFDYHCPEGERCYAALCGRDENAPAPGSCKASPPMGSCFGEEDCPFALICDGAVTCACGSPCEEQEAPGSCVRP